MEMRRLGTNGPAVSAVGLGCMGMSGAYGPTDEGEAVATIREALDRGVNFLNTGDFYGMGHNEMLIARAIEGRRGDAFISVKFGAQRSPDGAFLGFDARPAAAKTALAYTLQRLKTDYVDLYQPARVDPAVPIEETVGAIGELIQAGYVRHIGLSEASVASIRRAAAVRPIAALEVEYAVVTRDIEAETLPALRELGIGTVAYGVLSRGLIGGAANLGAPGDFRSHSPRFQGANYERNRRVVDAFGAIARDLGASPAQLAIAWALARGEDVIPLIAPRTRDRLADSLGALDLTLSADDLARIEQAVPVGAIAGDRYDERGMAMVNR